MLGISPRSAKYGWAVAANWLFKEISGQKKPARKDVSTLRATWSYDLVFMAIVSVPCAGLLTARFAQESQ